MALDRDQLIAELMKHPNIEVGTTEGAVAGVDESTYEPQDVAREILAVIPNHRRWLKGDFSVRHGSRVCLRGAMYRFGATEAEQEGFADLFCAVAAREYEQFSVLTETEGGVSRVCTINDDYDMTYERIRKLLEKIIAG